MKNFNLHLIFNKKTFLVGLLAIISALCFTLFANNLTAKANSNPTATLFMPYTPLEFDKSLSTPSHVYYDEDVLAVVQNKTGTPSKFELLISKNGSPFSCADQTFSVAINHIKRLSDKYLLVSSDSIVYAVDISSDLENPTISPLTKNNSTTQVTCTEFDYKDGILVTSWETSYSIYTVDTETLKATTITSGDDTAKEKTPVCLGDNALFFLDSNNNLKMREVSKEQTSNTSKTIIENLAIDKMIAKGDYIYAKSGTDIYKISISNKTKQKMEFNEDEEYQLSKVTSIGGFCFKGDNLLITDSINNTIQEFKIENNSLIFTGYAIADGKTAFNRFGKDIANIEQNGNMLATIDNVNKTFTLVSDVNESFYSRDNFKFSACFDKGDFEGFVPDAFALGAKSVLFVDKANKKARAFDLENNVLLEELTFSNVITDVTYQSGRYYLSQLKANNTSFDVVIYSGSETALLNNENLSEEFIITDAYNNSTLPIFTVDTFQNIYLTNTQKGYIYKYAKTEEGYSDGEMLSYAPTANLIKLSTDLTGGLFALSNTGMHYYDQVNGVKHDITFTSLPATISSFSMAMDKGQIYLSFNGEQFIYKAENLPIYSLDKLTCPNEFIISSNNAFDISTLKTCQIKDGANVYAFSYSEENGIKNIDYIELISLKEPLIFICEFSSTIAANGISREEAFYMLSGKDNDGTLLTAIVNKKDANLVTPEIGAVKEEFAYTTTGVSVYYLPIITKDANHILKDNNESVILNKNVKINTLNTITVFGIEYYFAKVTIGETTFTGYVPTAFTAKVLSKDYKEEKFSVEKVLETKVYSDEKLTTEIASLSSDTSIRLYSVENGVARIGYLVNDEWVEGYLSYSNVVQPENNVIKNVLIILLITISVCVTSLFFILRKK